MSQPTPREDTSLPLLPESSQLRRGGSPLEEDDTVPVFDLENRGFFRCMIYAIERGSSYDYGDLLFIAPPQVEGDRWRGVCSVPGCTCVHLKSVQQSLYKHMCRQHKHLIPYMPAASSLGEGTVLLK